jgi:hypothetical protein
LFRDLQHLRRLLHTEAAEEAKLDHSRLPRIEIRQRIHRIVQRGQSPVSRGVKLRGIFAHNANLSCWLARGGNATPEIAAQWLREV